METLIGSHGQRPATPSAPGLALVSIVMPVLNAERFLRQALASIQAQTYPHYEILVIDGGSTDATTVLAERAAQVRFMPQAGPGLASAWNTGLLAAQGQFVCFLDSDDLWASHKLTQQVNYLEQHPEAEFVIGHVKLFLEPGSPRPASLKPAALEGSHIGHMPGTLMARRRLFDAIGTFEPRWRIASDIEWFARLHDERIPGGELPAVLLYRRVHEANLSQLAGPRMIRRELLQIMKLSLERRRRASGGANPNNEY